MHRWGLHKHQVQVQSAILELSLTLSSRTMTEYGVSRLEELTIKQDSSNPTPISARLDEIVGCLSNLAESLRKGESGPKPSLTNRTRTFSAARVRRSSSSRELIASRCEGRPVEIIFGSGTCRS